MPLPILGFAHVNLNCTRLDRSRAFFESALGLSALVHTCPEPQDCGAFGITGPGQWDAWMLGDVTALVGGCAIDLLEWKQPRPLGRARAEPGCLGLRALGFTVSDPDGALVRIEAAGGRALLGVAERPEPDGETQALHAARDPDGVALTLLEGPRPGLRFVELGCSDLERSLSFYRQVLGLRGEVRAKPGRAAKGAFGCDHDCAWQSAPLALPQSEAPAAQGFHVELTQWTSPRAGGRAAGEAHHVGLYRMALRVDDVDACHAELRGLGVAGLSAPADLDLGPECPAPRCRALFFRDPDGCCLELIEVPEAGGA